MLPPFHPGDRLGHRRNRRVAEYVAQWEVDVQFLKYLACQ